MKNLDLRELGVEEMNEAQMTEVEGGWDWTGAWGGAAAGACLGPEGMLVGFVVGGLLY